MEKDMNKNELNNRWALVTGASSGLGSDFARQLAEMGCNLILTARRVDRLECLRDEIAAKFGVDVEILPADLSQADSAQALYDRIQAAGWQVDVLINNAGYGLFGDFLARSAEETRAMLQVNVMTVVQLTHLFASDMVKRGLGYILLVASTGAYQPAPTFSAYAASKSFILSFGEALNYELRKTGVKVSVLSPGATHTEFHEVSGHGEKGLFMSLTMMDSPAVTRIGLDALLKGRPSVIAGAVNWAQAELMRFLPRRWATAFAAGAMQTDTEKV